MICLNVDVTEPEYTEVQVRNQRARRGQRALRRIRSAVVCLFSIGGVYTIGKNSISGTAFLMALLTPVLILIGIIVASIKKPSLGKAYRQAIVTLNGSNVEIDSEGYRWNTVGKTQGIVYWPAFSGWMETPHTITLRRGALLYILPKAALSDASQIELRTLCVEKIGAEGELRAIHPSVVK